MATVPTVRTLGVAIRDARRGAGLTQQQLADRSGVTRQWVIQLELGKANPTFENLRAVCDVLDLTMHLHPSKVDAAGTLAGEPLGAALEDVDLDEIIERHTRRRTDLRTLD